MVDDSDDPTLNLKRQCELLGLNRTSIYYKPKIVSPAHAAYIESCMSAIDYWHTLHPALGARKLAKIIRENNSLPIGRKRVTRLMAKMGIKSLAPKPNTSKPNKKHKKYPYLLRNKAIWLPNQVWAIDITYIRMGRSHMYLCAIIDWFSRYIIGWRLSETLESAPVVDVVKEAIDRYGLPAIINSDQGSQFTSFEYTELLRTHRIEQSMDGKGRWVDNVIIERWFRSLKCDEIYINEYPTPKSLREGIRGYVTFYNNIRPHMNLGDKTPQAIYNGCFALMNLAA